MGRNLLTDPRPELVEDSKLWELLFRLSAKESPRLTSLLNTFRCCGTRLINKDSRIIMVPTIDVRLGFETRQEYEELRYEHLVPHQSTIVKLLVRLEL